MYRRRRTFRPGITGGDEGDEGGPAGLLGGGEGLLDPAAHPSSHGCYVWAHFFRVYCCGIVVFGVVETIDTRGVAAIGGSQNG